MSHKSPILLLQGSSRSQGDTRLVIDHLRRHLAFDFVDLLDLRIGHFDYEFRHREDDFLPLMRRFTADYETLLVATPVYWYAMSGILKDFFDRISDLLKIEKDTGRLLRGKNLAMLSCSGADDRIASFGDPFLAAADYLGMKYLGDVHVWVEEGAIPPLAQQRLANFADQLFSPST